MSNLAAEATNHERVDEEVWVKRHHIVDLSSIDPQACYLLNRVSRDVRLMIFELCMPYKQSVRLTTARYIGSFWRHAHSCRSMNAPHYQEEERRHCRLPSQLSDGSMIASEGKLAGAQIYSYLSCGKRKGELYKAPESALALMQTCSAIQEEVRAIFYSSNSLSLPEYFHPDYSGPRQLIVEFLSSLGSLRLECIRRLTFHLNTEIAGFKVARALSACTALHTVEITFHLVMCRYRTKFPIKREMYLERIGLVFQSLSRIRGMTKVVLHGEDTAYIPSGKSPNPSRDINDTRARGPWLIAEMMKPKTDENKDELINFINANQARLDHVNAEIIRPHKTPAANEGKRKRPLEEDSPDLSRYSELLLNFFERHAATTNNEPAPMITPS